jgi:hypothetical protein
MDRFTAIVPPDDGGDFLGVPEEDRSALAEILLHCLAIEACRLESRGERLRRPACDDDRIAAVVDEVHARAVEHVASGGSLAELRSRLKGLRKATWGWSRPLPLGPGDGPVSLPRGDGDRPDEAPTDPSWLIRGLFPDSA